MQNFFKKCALSAMVAGAALAVAACGGNNEAPVENTVDLNATTDLGVEGTTNDMTSMDATAGADLNATDANLMSNDMGLDNSLSNSTNAL